MTAPAEDRAEDADEPALALDMIEVHGASAAIVARENARIEALAGRGPRAKSWMRILGIIQRRQSGQRAGGPRQSDVLEPEGTSLRPRAILG
jgi:hypothetical protein